MNAPTPTSTPTPTVTGDRVIAIVLLATAATLFGLSLGFPPPGQDFDPGTAALPRIVAVVLALLALLLMVKAERTSPLSTRDRTLRVAATVVLSIGFALTLEPLGFIIASTAFMISALLLIGVRRVLPLVLVPLCISVGLHMLFSYVLDVFLPIGILGAVVPGLGA